MKPPPLRGDASHRPPSISTRSLSPRRPFPSLSEMFDGSTCSIVDDFDSNLLSISRHMDNTLMSTTMPDDIRHSFAHSPGENRFNSSWKSIYSAIITVEVVGDV